jgi:TRAP-type C4-dicarboxylate transport system permease small subunit
MQRLPLPSATPVIDIPIRIILASALLGELAVVFINVVSREVTGRSLPWTDEAAEMALSTIAFLGGAAAYRRREHASIRALVPALPASLQRICQIVSEWFVLTVPISVGWYSVPYLLAQSEQLTAVLQLPASWFVVPLLAAMAVIAWTRPSDWLHSLGRVC